MIKKDFFKYVSIWIVITSMVFPVTGMHRALTHLQKAAYNLGYKEGAQKGSWVGRKNGENAGLFMGIVFAGTVGYKVYNGEEK